MAASKRLFDKLAGKQPTEQDAAEVFAAFDADKDGKLSRKELENLLNRIATSGSFEAAQVDKIVAFLDKDKDGTVGKSDFLSNGRQWLRVVLSAPAALVVVDVQNDFIDGSLALSGCPAKQDGAEVVPVVNRLVERLGASLAAVIYSLDWHPADHISFDDNIGKRKFADSSKVKQAELAKVGDTVVLQTASYGPVEQRLWPRHCVQNSKGAELHPQLKLPAKYVKVYKGTDPDIDSYSAFWDNNKQKKTELHERLSSFGVRDVFVCGLATDVCVGATAAHAQELGYRTILVDDACRGVLLDDIQATKDGVCRRSGVVVKSDMVQKLAQKSERPAALVAAAADCACKLPQ